MRGPSYIPTVHDHIEAARKCNVALQFQLSEVKMDREWTLKLLNRQARNLEEIKKFLSAQLAAANDLPPEAMHELDRLIEGVEDVTSELPSPEDSNVVKVQFGEHGADPFKTTPK